MAKVTSKSKSESISEGRKESQELRDKVNQIPSLKLINFFKPFDTDKLLAFKGAIDNAMKSKKKRILANKQKELERVQKEIAELKIAFGEE